MSMIHLDTTTMKVIYVWFTFSCLLVTLRVVESHVCHQQSASASSSALECEDTSLDPYIFQSHCLPSDMHLFPSVGNGHLATNIYTDTVFINGLYNGIGGHSHRARIQSVHAINISDMDTYTYTLHTKSGIYEANMESDSAAVTYRTYAHSYFNRLLVTEVQIERKQHEGDIKINYLPHVGTDSEDCDWQDASSYNSTYRFRKGKTKDKETEDQEDRYVYLYWTPMNDGYFILPKEHQSVTFEFIFAIDYAQAGAKAHFDLAYELYLDKGKLDDFRQLHIANWESLWSSGKIELKSTDLNLQKSIAGAFYYFFSNLPSPRSFTPSNPFFGLSPGGLANGKEGVDYNGHVFWDMETWMYPGILMFQPEMAREMLHYRIRNMDQAFARAAENGQNGTRFPWESAYTGAEVCPTTCMACRNNEQHITGDVAYAARQYMAATGDMDWLKQKEAGLKYSGGDLMHEVGHFWYTRAQWNATKKRYDINGVMPPDEYEPSINNSVYTNLGANYAINTAAWAACLAGQHQEVDWKSWLHVAKELTFTYNKEKQYHEEFEGFDDWLQNNPTGKVKQADAVLLGFPLLWNMPKVVHQNDLKKYEPITDENGPAMTWSMFAMGWLDFGLKDKAAEYFNKSYQPYVRQPFKIWTEVQTGTGAVNFLTGTGGFLQAVIFGYGGLRLYPNYLLVKKKFLPPDTSEMVLRNMDYRQNTFDLKMTADLVSLTHVTSDVDGLILEYSGIKTLINKPGKVYEFDRVDFKLYPSISSPCPPPLDAIDVDYGNTHGSKDEF